MHAAMTRTLFTCATLATLTACGPGADEDPVPPGATITVSPQSKEWTITPATDPAGNPVCLDGVYQDHTLSIVVQDRNGVPLGDVDLIVRADLAANTSSFDVIRIYDDINANGVADHPQELVTGDNSPAFFTRTGKFDGTRVLLVRANLSCAYRGDITVHAGSAFGSASIDVKADGP